MNAVACQAIAVGGVNRNVYHPAFFGGQTARMYARALITVPVISSAPTAAVLLDFTALNARKGALKDTLAWGASNSVLAVRMLLAYAIR